MTLLPWEEVIWENAPDGAEWHTTDYFGAAWWKDEPVYENQLWRVREPINTLYAWPNEYIMYGFYPREPHVDAKVTIAKRDEKTPKVLNKS